MSDVPAGPPDDLAPDEALDAEDARRRTGDTDPLAGPDPVEDDGFSGAGSPSGEPVDLSVDAGVPAPTPTPVVDQKPIEGLTLDRCLIYGILQAGILGLFRSRDLGLLAEHLDSPENRVYEALEKFIPKNRLPNMQELQVLAGINLTVPSTPYDVETFAQKIVTRALRAKLSVGIKEVMVRDLLKDPAAARDGLSKLVRETSFSLGQASSYTDPSTSQGVLDDYFKAKAAGGGLMGVSSPWPNVDKRSLGLIEGELTVLLAKRKMGKTLAASTLTHDPMTGRERTISELVQEGKGLVATWQKNGPITAASPTAYMDCGEKECFKITYRSGREMIAAPTHPFLTPRGWLRLDELQVGHHTAAVKKLPEPLKPVAMYDDEVKILAYMIADGGCTGGTPVYTKYDEALVSDLAKSVSALRCELRSHSKHGVYSIVGDGRNRVSELLRAHDLMGEKSVDKVIPQEIFSLDDEQLGLFLGRLWSGDGSVEASGLVSYSTGSHRMALQIQHLLLRFGVASRVRAITRDTDHGTYYEVRIHREDIGAFKANVKLIGEKADKLTDVVFEGRSRVGWIKNDEMSDLIRTEMNARPELLKDVGDELGYEFSFQKGHVYDSKTGRIRRHVFRAFCEVYNSSLAWVLDENIWWDEIESIEPAGKHHCYDLTVEPTACYVANDYVVHNSWMLLKWMLHALYNDLKAGENLLIVSLEMPVKLCYRRLAAIDLKLPYEAFRNGTLTTAEEEKLQAWVENAKVIDPKRPTIHVIGPNTARNVDDIVAKAAEYRPRVVAIDGFYILGRSSKMNMWERTVENVSQIKLDLCAGLNMPVLATTQFKGTKGKDELKVDADDAAYAKAIGDWADAMRGLVADAEMDNNRQRLFVGMESREFRPVDILINFNLDVMDFSEIKVVEATEQFSGAGDPGKPGAPPAPGSLPVIITGSNPASDSGPGPVDF